MYKIIDTKAWNRSTQYHWFNSFSNPCYGIDIKLDVTEIVLYSKHTQTSFFINFLFILMKSLNQVEELRLRIVEDEVRLYDTIHPTYTVMTELGVFENCKNQMHSEYKPFYEECHSVIEAAKKQTSIKETYNEAKHYDVYYITCLPWLSYEAMTHPVPNDDRESLSVPRICFGKFERVGDRFMMPFNLTVSHALVDGYPCSKALNALKENCSKAKVYFA